MLAVHLTVLLMIGGAYGSIEVYQYFETVLRSLRLNTAFHTDLNEVPLADFNSEFTETVANGVNVTSKVEFKDGVATGLAKPRRVLTCRAPYFGSEGKAVRCTVAFDNLKIDYRKCEVAYGDMPKVEFTTDARVSRAVFSVEVSKKGADAAKVTVEVDGQDFMLVRFQGLGPLSVFTTKMGAGFRNGLKGEPQTKVVEALKAAFVKVVAVAPFPAD